jgi:hypothetical protein
MGVEARAALLVALVVVFAAASAGCTTFVGAELRREDDDATSTSSASTGAGGEGGAGGGATANDPDAYLPVVDAAELCAMAGECPLFAASLVASIGVPIMAVRAAAPQRLTLSYSACLDWLASPLAEGRIGFETQRELLYDVLPSGCSGGLELLPIEAFGGGDPRCEGVSGQSCDGDRLVDCDAGLALACRAPPYSVATTCIETGEGTATCGIPSPCDGAPPSCDGTYSVTCTADVLSAFDCATIGLGCSDATPGACGGESGAASCAVDAFGDEACTPDGERATLCLGGAVGETDCDAAGLSCVDDGATARCGDPDAEASGERCRPYDPDVDVCAGDVLHACIGGARVDVDCASFGRKCVPPFSLPNLALSARCAVVAL